MLKWNTWEVSFKVSISRHDIFSEDIFICTFETSHPLIAMQINTDRWNDFEIRFWAIQILKILKIDLLSSEYRIY